MAEPPINPQCPKRRGILLGDGTALDGHLRTGSGGPGLLECEDVRSRVDRRIAIDFARDAAARLISFCGHNPGRQMSLTRAFLTGVFPVRSGTRSAEDDAWTCRLSLNNGASGRSETQDRRSLASRGRVRAFLERRRQMPVLEGKSCCTRQPINEHINWDGASPS
jgi:hypothetical protein